MPLHPTKNDLPEEVRTKMVALLNASLADALDLETQTKQAHWNVKGANFIALHELFDDIHEDVGGYVDEIAERAVQLGGQVHGTARAAAAASKLPEYPLDISASKEHVAALSSALAAFGKLVRKAIDDSDQAGDADTADLFTGVSRGVDKWLWMVEAHAQTEK